ncbi:MAG: hypothetical protein QOJ48_2518 [Frankiales bacterium]|nr:hypothetical protein [Frankiales bacterium]
MNAVEGWFLTLLNLVVLGTCLYALVDAVRRPAAAFVAHGKLTKPIWTGILVGAILIALLLGFFSFIGAFALVAAIVYLVDVKPALSGTNNW